MSSALGPEEVKKIAKLSRLALTTEELSRYQAQLAKILESMEELSRLDTAEVPPTTSVLGLSSAWRKDEPRPFDGADKIIALAPESEGRYFKVKKIIE